MGKWTLTADECHELLRFLRLLVQTPSYSGAEEKVARIVMEEMHNIGYDDVVMDDAGNVIGRIGPMEGPSLMLNSHMDTVNLADPDAWIADPFSALISDGQLYGLGSCDMKGGLAATVYAGALLIRNQTHLKGPVYVTIVGLEEPAEGTCTQHILSSGMIVPTWVVIAEPSNLSVVRAQRGHMEMRVVVKGKSSHSSQPDLGKNAVYEAARLIFGLEILAGELVEDPFLGSGVLAVTDIKSHAVSRNAVPHKCEFVIDRRLTVGETESMALAEVERIISREGVNAQVQVIEEEIKAMTGKVFQARKVSLPWALDEKHPLVLATVSAVRNVGIKPSLTRWHFATEGAYTASVAHIPTVGFGPGNPSLAHTSNEHIPIAQVYAAASAYAALCEELLG
ncbi:MAG: YgeY family selenium metabolism-linked hydrolase [Anaerolineae bacterium]|nr:YgeY family selenium metabolism-linked hydrolase [Anaerolineae bacterium]